MYLQEPSKLLKDDCSRERVLHKVILPYQEMILYESSYFITCLLIILYYKLLIFFYFIMKVIKNPRKF